MPRLPFRNSFDYLRAATFYDALTPQSKDALCEIILEEDFMGSTDPQTLGLLYAWIANNNYSSLLQLGTWMGFSAIVLADALKRSQAIYKTEISFDTVEHEQSIHDRARAFIARAGLDSLIRCIDGSSLDPEVIVKLRPQYDCIYVDSSHAYQETLREIDIYYPRLRPGGIMIFHDASQHATTWDPTEQGGVRKALNEWITSASRPAQYLFLEKPFWVSDCGLFIARKSTSA